MPDGQVVDGEVVDGKVVDGKVLDATAAQGSVEPVVVVTTMPLSESARADLGVLLGDQFVVVDIKSAPSTANIVLTTVVSAQALGALRGTFPDARILLTEVHDAERGISYAGPLTRVLANGPDGYFVAHELEALAPIVESEALLQLTGSRRQTPMLGSSSASATAPPVGPAPPGTVRLVTGDVEGGDTDRLDLEAVDRLVAAMLGSGEPRAEDLWAVVAAECAEHRARETGRTVLVDVTGLPAHTLLWLRARLGPGPVA